MCEEFAIHLGSPFILPPVPTSSPFLASLRPSFSTLSCRSRILSLSLFIHTRLLLFLPSLLRRILFSPILKQLTFHRSSSWLAFLFYLSPVLPSPPAPAPFLLARFISARCQFEFGTRATGQRVSTKNQFLNARLFRAEGPAWYLPVTILSTLFSLCHCCFDFFRRDADTEMHRLAG